MQYRKFGDRIDWKPSALGFGCMRLPSKKILFGLIKKVNVPEAIRIIRYAIDNGVNYIDTAYGYHQGKSEIIVGQALKDGYREKVHLVTKLPIWKVKSEDDVERLCNEQMQKLGVDYLDIYLVHAMNKARMKTLRECNVMEAMRRLKEQGKIRHIGFSFHDNYQVFKEIIDEWDEYWECCQIQYNYMDTAIQATTKGLEYAASKGIGVIIMEPLKGGRLANPPPEVKEIFDSAPVKRTPVDWALQFLWNRPEVSVVLSGMSSYQQVVENLASADASGVGKLSKEEVEILERVAEIFRKAILVPCTSCEYCLEVCPSGVAIPQHFSLLNDLSREKGKNLKKIIKKYRSLAMTKEALNDARNNGMATLCTKCRKCVEACPQGIDIPVELEKVHAILGDEQRPYTELYPQE